MGTARARIAAGLIAALLALAPQIAAAAPVTQEHFRFVDRNMGLSDKPFDLALARDGDREFAVLFAVDDDGNTASVGFWSEAEWQRFATLWQEAKASMIAADGKDKVWDFIADVDQTKLTVMTSYGALEFDIRQPGAGVCEFSLDKETEPSFDAAVIEISARFKAGH
jgi:hypothetical protein